MALYTWIGGGDNLASDPRDWSPNHRPQAGDTLALNPNGTINIVGNALHGDTLQLNGNGGAAPIAYTLNVSGISSFSINDGSPVGYGEATVNLAANSMWIGGLGIGPYGQGAVVQGRGIFFNTSSFIDNAVSIGVPVVGNGAFQVNSAHQTAKLEFMHSVSAGQSISIGGYAAYGGEFGTVQVDDSEGFRASVTLGYGELILKGVHADSYALRNDILSMYQGNRVVDSVRLAISTTPPNENGPSAFGVTQTAAGIVIHADGSNAAGHAWDGGVALPIHT